MAEKIETGFFSDKTMTDELYFTNSQVNCESTDEDVGIGEDYTRLSVPAADESGEVNDFEAEKNASRAKNLISPFSRHNNGADSTRDEVASYLQKIARTPLLTRDEEAALFQQFEAGRQRVAELLDQLPPLILDKVRSKASPRRSAKKKSQQVRDPRDSSGTWWSPMNIAAVLEEIQKEIRAYPRGQMEDSAAPVDYAKAGEHLQKLWLVLHAAAQQMQDAKLKVVEANLLLVASIAKGHYFPRASLSFLDLMQEGSIGLMKAVEKFDWKRGYRFCTYATWWIMQAIRRALDDHGQTIRIPCYIRDAQRKIKQTRAKLAVDLQREPDIEEIAQAVQMSESRVDKLLQSAKDPISLSSPLSESLCDATISHLLADESQPTPEEALLSNSKKALLQKVLGTLLPREAIVIQLRYGLTNDTESNLAEIGAQLGISRERVRQIEQDALSKLRHPMRAQYLKDLL